MNILQQIKIISYDLMNNINLPNKLFLKLQFDSSVYIIFESYFDHLMLPKCIVLLFDAIRSVCLPYINKFMKFQEIYLHE